MRALGGRRAGLRWELRLRLDPRDRHSHIVISQPFWPAQMSEERFEKARRAIEEATFLLFSSIFIYFLRFLEDFFLRLKTFEEVSRGS